MTSWQERPDRTTLRLMPFRGVRYTATDLGELTFTPPTSWSSVPVDLLPALNPHHVLHLLSPAFGADPQAGASRARASLVSWLADGVLRRDAEAALYVYEQPGVAGTVRGVIAPVDLTTATPALLDHEEVIDAVVETQEILERTLRAQIEPILALHRSAPTLRAALADATRHDPDATAESDDGTHRLWRVTDPATIDHICHAVPDEPALVADGHHRHAAWRRTRPEALTLLTDASQPGLRLGAIHRVVEKLDPQRVLASPATDVRALSGRDAADRYLETEHGPHCVLYVDGGYYSATPREPSAPCAAPELAVCHLHAHWLPQWGVGEADVGYVHDPNEAIALAGPGRAAVLLPVPAIGDVVDAARDGHPLPRKATSFRPKPLVGTVLHTPES